MMKPVLSLTPTQYALAVCFLLAGPGFGVLGALIQRRRRENAAFGALVACAGSWAAWIVSCFVALVLFPRYPVSGSPPEPVAMLFTAPGFVAGAVVLAWLASRRAPVRGTVARIRTQFGVVIGATTVLGFGLVKAHIGLTRWPARRELPDGAVVLEERAFQDGFLPDFSYRIRARMTEQDFRVWVERLGLRATSERPLRYEREGSSEFGCGASASYNGEIGLFSSWCS